MANTRVKRTGVTATTASFDWPGGPTLATAFGTWAGATATLQATYDDGTTWIDIDSGGVPVAFTANDGQAINLPNNADGFRWSISGGPPNLTLILDTMV